LHRPPMANHAIGHERMRLIHAVQRLCAQYLANMSLGYTSLQTCTVFIKKSLILMLQ
jgi:hypothetical protein